MYLFSFDCTNTNRDKNEEKREREEEKITIRHIYCKHSRECKDVIKNIPRYAFDRYITRQKDIFHCDTKNDLPKKQIYLEYGFDSRQQSFEIFSHDRFSGCVRFSLLLLE